MMLRCTWILALVVVATYITGPLVDPDLWWHIVVGRWIVAHGQIPRVDYWNAYAVGTPWRAYSWLPEIVAALTERWYHVRGLIWLKLGLASLIALSFGALYRTLSRDGFVGMLLGAYVTASCFNHFTLRPQSLTWVLLAVLLMLAERIAVRGRSPVLLAGLAGVLCLWANTHLTTALALFILAGWLWGRVPSKTLGASLGAAFLGTLCTPYLGGEWITFFKKSGHPLHYQSIAEFQPATILQYSTGFALLMFALAGLFLIRAKAPVEYLGRIACSLFMLGGGLAVVKFLPLFMIVSGALVASLWAAESGRVGHLAEALEKCRRALYWLPLEGTAFVLLVLIYCNASRTLEAPLATDIIPARSMDYIINNHLPMPLLHDFGRGGYVLYRFADNDGNPGYLVPIDGRTNVTPPDVMAEAGAALMGHEDWEKFFDRVQPKTVLWRVESPLTSILKARGDWIELFREGDKERGFVVLGKR